MDGCLNCSTNRVNPPSCVCKDGMYENAEGNCVTCPSHCATCSDATTCYTCSVEERSPAPDCPCIDGYYEEANVCVACNFKCLTCADSSDNCTTCADSRTGLPDCTTCPEGSFDDSVHVDC